MHDGSSALISTAAYTRIYEEQQPRLVAYARSLTRNTWVAEDLVAEAHFRVWRRLAEGHEIDNVSAYLTTTVRHLAYAAGGAVRETPRDPHDAEQAVAGRDGDDPADRVSSVDLLVRVLGQLPERWVKALWLAEAEGQPLAQIGPQLGTKDGATAVLLHRAREGMRQAFLRTQTGAPDDPACQVHWSRMPAYVRGAATERQSDRLLGHVDGCEDCRTRLAALMRANDRLPALVGPALLVFAVGGTAGRFLLTLTAAGASTGAHGGGSGLLHGIRQATGIGGTKTPVVAAAGAMAAGAAALVLVLGPGQASPAPAQRTPVADAPAAQVPVTEAPAAPASTPSPTAPETATGGSDGGGTTADATAPVGTAVPPTSEGTGAGNGSGSGDGDGSGDGSGNGDGNGGGGTDTAPPTAPEPAPPATKDPAPPSTPPVTTDPTPPATTDPTPPATTPPATTDPTPPAEPTDPTPPAGPTDPAPVDPPPGDDDCPPGHGDTGDGTKPGGKGRADGAGDVEQPPARHRPHPSAP
ncbi:sigma-70 family RNA polymerase sigma factor [Streptomyces humi]|uniref:sigma-70 family RNA polymerase sigma factor n=1 Tax=Streptomyces humi TaxID=1428620 RepID=UPI000699B0C9|nr:sigma-70 family RNA polymerase sigma factor [Streptomyces humi]